MRTSGEKVRISDEAERVRSFIFSYKTFVRVIYSGVFKGRQARHLLRAPFATAMCKVAHLAFKGAQSNCNALLFQRAP